MYCWDIKLNCFLSMQTSLLPPPLASYSSSGAGKKYTYPAGKKLFEKRTVLYCTVPPSDIALRCII